MKLLFGLSIMFLSTCLQAEAIKPNANLIIDGIPELSSEIVEKARLYNDFHPTTLVDVHPLTSEMLIKMRPMNGRVIQIFLRDSEGAIKQLTDFDDGVMAACYEPITGRYCVFSKDTNGKENHQNYRYDFENGEITLLTDGQSRNSLGVWSPKGDQMAYCSNRRNGKDQDVYLIDPLNPGSDRLIKKFSDGDAWGVLDWSPDGKKLLVQEFKSACYSSLWILDLESYELNELLPQTDHVSVYYGSASYSPDGKSVYLISDLNSEYKCLYRLDLSTNILEPLTAAIHWDVEAYSVRKSDGSIVYVCNENGISKLHLLTFAKNGNADQIYGNIPSGVIHSMALDNSEKRLVFDLCSSKFPSEVFSLDLDQSSLTQLTTTKNLIDTSTFIEPELVFWKSFDGKIISGFLYRPLKQTADKIPVEIVVHGGPEAQFRPVFLSGLNYHINELGVALLFPNIRGSTGYGKSFLKLADGLKRVDAYEDINALLDWVKQQPDLDHERIMVGGGSYGGHIALVAATRYDSKIACSISVVGMSNLVTFLENTDERRRDFRRSVYGDERVPEIRSFLESIAPINHVQNITKPIFIIQGLMDPRIPYSEAEQMVKAIKDKKHPVWFLTAKNEGHGFSKKENMDYQFYATIEFIQRYLITQVQQ